MKTFKTFYVIAFISIVAFACSSDDDSSSTQENQAKLVGTWKFTSSTTNGEVDTDNYICDFEETYAINSTTVTISFYEDPSEENGPNCQFVDSFTFDYDINGDILSDDEGNSIKILTLNNTTLIFEETESYEGTTYTYTETYTKQ